MRQRPPTPNAHWLAHFVFLHMRLANITQAEMLERAGFSRTSFQRWWKGTSAPTVLEVEALLGVFGYALKPTPANRQAFQQKEKPHAT